MYIIGALALSVLVYKFYVFSTKLIGNVKHPEYNWHTEEELKDMKKNESEKKDKAKDAAVNEIIKDEAPRPVCGPTRNPITETVQDDKEKPQDGDKSFTFSF